MKFPRLVALAWLAAALLPAAVLAQSGGASVTTERVHAELLAHAPDGVEAGKPLWVGLQITHQPEWHTYWKNPGDSGLPTQLTWSLPAGVTAGDIAWPVPKKIPIGTLANYGYEGTVLLPVPLTVTPAFQPSPFGSAEIRLKASWLVCKQECIPEEGSFTLKLPVRSTTALHRPQFEAAWSAQPQPLPGTSEARIDGQQLRVSVSGLPAAAQGRTLQLFPETGEVIDNAAAWHQSWQDGTWTAYGWARRSYLQVMTTSVATDTASAG